MTSVGHRKNFMKAITNLKMIFNGTSGKNSDYIKQKIQKFYEKNRQKNAKMGLFNSLGSNEGQGRFYSHNFFTKNLFQSNNQIIEEDDEHSVKFDTNHSPNMGPKSDNENNIQSLALSGDRKLSRNNESGSEGENKTQEFEDDEEIMQARPKPIHKEDSKGSSRDNENNQTNKSPPIEGKGSSKQNPDQKHNLIRMPTDNKIGSPSKKLESSEKQAFMDEMEDAKMEANGQHTSKHEKGSPVNLHDLSSSDTSSSSSSSEDERSKKVADEKAKEEALAQSTIIQKIVRADSKVEKKTHKKATSLGVNNFRSAEFAKSKSSSQYREDGKRKKNNRNRKRGGT